MKTLGLYHLIRDKQAQIARLENDARRPRADPRSAHDYEVEAGAIRREVVEMTALASSNENLHQNLSQLLHYATTSNQKSRYRSLVITAIEEALNWIHRENGDPIPDRNFKPVED